MCADTGGHSSSSIYRDSEVGSVHFTILRDHSLQTELLGSLIRDRDADQATTMSSHEIDRGGSCFFRRHDEVPFVLAIRVVSDNDHPAIRDVAHNIVNSIKLKR